MSHVPATPTGSVAGKVVLITGSNRGIGLAAVKLFLSNGAQVFLTDLNLSNAREQLSSYDSKTVGFLEGDVTSETSITAVCEAAVAQFGQLDGAVLNAGLSFGVKPWLETTVEEVDRLHSVNVRGSFATAKAAVKSMIASPSGGKGCSIVFVSSVAATYGEVGMAGYTASKWAVRGLSLTASQEFARYGIRANCIQPGATNTEMFATFPPETQALICDTNVLKRPADPTEIAQAMLWFISDASSFVSGSTLAVHAGQTPT